MPESSISRDYEMHANPTTNRYQLTLVRINLNKNLQTINAEGVMEKCIPSTLSGT